LTLIAPWAADALVPGMALGAGLLAAAPRFRAFIGMGGNLGDVRVALNAALSTMQALPATRVEAVSPLYRSKPVDAEGPDYLNAVAVLDTALAPRELLSALHGIETGHGRERAFVNAPRLLDLDLLWHGDATRSNAFVSLPHPRMMQRAFVLLPLADVLGELPFEAEKALRASMPNTEMRARLAQNQGIERVF
jgi:2-amino-4-hydroxy-6-hydroxymethyldihydropteridine diphosphokinase